MEISNAEKAEVSRVEHVGSDSTTQELRDHPKTWNWILKALVLTNICFMVFCGNFYSAGISAGLTPLVHDFNSNYKEASKIVAYSVLCIGLGAFLWIPTAVVFGKRPVLLASQCMFMAGCIWATQASTMNSLFGSRIIGALGAGAVQAVGPAVIGEIFLEKNYSKAMAAYSISLCLGAQGSPLIAGHLIAAKGWQWFFILVAILSGVNFLTLLFLCPETAFNVKVELGATSADFDADIFDQAGRLGPSQSPIKTWRQNSFYKRHPHVRGGGARQWFLSFLLQIEYAFDPIVLLSAGMWGIALAWVATISVICNQLFAPPPFLWGPAQLGNWACTSLIGVFLALPIAGPLTDALSSFFGRRKGKHMPEYRLYTLIVPLVICSPGLLLFGYTYPKGSYVGPAVGYAMEAAGLMLIPTSVLSYAIDSYPYDSSEVVALMNAVTHLISFGLVETASDWLTRVGVEKLFLQMAIIQWALIAALSVILIIFGPWIRTKASLIHQRYGAKRFL
ncbi:unnamed protein product [Clonostachys solani]|uniref:Major facilitator superfamily (MFS) profile domain-containing protein n=1 Tax=Clonostachys solani TaxID=160281 RepID=A0A9N9ZHP5_9HYPO|nr:unnamed protein product [Clonostachys solani]